MCFVYIGLIGVEKAAIVTGTRRVPLGNEKVRKMCSLAFSM